MTCIHLWEGICEDCLLDSVVESNVPDINTSGLRYMGHFIRPKRCPVRDEEVTEVLPAYETSKDDYNRYMKGE